MPLPSRIFTGFRALGFTSNHIPLDVRYHHKHKENYVVTCVGKAFHVYNCSRLGITSVSNVHQGEISCLAVDAYLVYTAVGKDVQAFSRGREVCHRYNGHEHDVHIILPFADHLITVDTASCLKVWHIKSQELYTEIEFDNGSFEVTTAMHPNTYKNKILLGSKQGALQLWNINTNKLIHTFQGWKSPVTVMTQAPAVDVVAVGLADGRIVLHNLKYDDTVMTFTQDWGPITAISFRTDGPAVMVTGSPAGHIALWNLEERKLQSQIREAHHGSVSGLQCLPNEPLMVTSSPDNSLKVWIFDMPDGGGRLLRQRSGHSAPPSKVNYHGEGGQNIISAGQDSTIRSFSTVHDRHNKSLGRASYNKAETKRTGLKADKHMMPPVTDFATNPNRQSDWDSIVACHRNESLVTTWNYSKSTMGAHKLKHPRFEDRAYHNTAATCADLSPCGNFCAVGYSSGHVDVYNMQSGLHRGSYGGKDKAHHSTIRGVCIDGLNQVTVTAGGDCTIKFWRFKSKQLISELTLDAQIAKIQLHRESSMLAVATDDFRVLVVDLDSRKVVRTFTGHANSVTDMTFSSDGRWLVTASMDSTVRTWDLPSGRLLDGFVVDFAVTSLSMSPTSDFLVTTHVDDLGVYLWSNMTIYGHVALRPLPADFEPQLMGLPSTSRKSQGPAEKDKEVNINEEEEDYLFSDFKSPAQISNELVTMSLLPNSRWQNLLHLDVIKARNKPKEPPKVPKAAPFFLPTIAGLETKFAAIEEEKEDSTKSHYMQSSLLPLTKFGELVQKTEETKQYDNVISALKELGPSAIDSELRCLGPDAGGSVELLKHFLVVINHQFTTNTDFELTQAYLGLFLKLHGDIVANNDELKEELKRLQDSQKQAWIGLQKLFNESLCLVSYLNSAAL